MRVTPGITRSRAVADFQRTTKQFADLSRQVSTGERFTYASEDPIYAGDVAAATRALSELGQASRAQAAARTRLETEDQVLGAISDLLARAKELAFSQGDGGGTPETRQAAQVEVDQMIDQLISMGNTRVGSEFIFAGDVAATPPFQGTTYVGGSLPREMEILPGQRLVTALTGQQLFRDSGVLDSVIALRDALGTGNQGPVVAALDGLDAAMTETERFVAESGARLRRLEVAETAMADQEALTMIRRDRSGGVDQAESMARFLAVEAALQTSAAALQRVLSLNLVQYLR